jgi:hypothetical protein
LVELNATIFPLLGPIGSFVNTIKVLVGGVFGIYLIILYLRWREYRTVYRLLREIRKDIHDLAERQGVVLAPIKKTKMQEIGQKLKEKLREKPEEQYGPIQAAYHRKDH